MTNAIVDNASNDTIPDLTICDVEPIHIPGSIQPHGLLLVVDPATSVLLAGAGDIENRLASDWLGKSLDKVVPEYAGLLSSERGALSEFELLGQVNGQRETFDASIHRTADVILIELEPAPDRPPSGGVMLTLLDNMASSFGRSADLQALCDQAALAFRRLTGFDRVMIYRFVDDDAGTVVAAAQDENLHSFVNHHFPASDIPKQARALYVRNRVRVIPDVGYVPAPLRPPNSGQESVDMSDVSLRSVSPIHIQYLKNMGVGASASVSIVKDGLLWGLVACHHQTPRNLTYDVRAACRSLAGSLARQIRSKEEAANYRERIRLRSAEDAIAALLAHEGSPGETYAETRDDMQRLLDGDGFAFVHGKEVEVTGVCPDIEQLRELATWLFAKTTSEPFSTNQLSGSFAPAADYQAAASGLLAVTLPFEEPSLFIWCRVQELEVINWAGNPHKEVKHDPSAILNPRSSFEAWSETVSGKARRWTLGEAESAVRLRHLVFEARQNRRLREVNRELAATLADKEGLLRQKDFLVKEVNHRVQNSLQLVSAFLSMQAHSLDDQTVINHLTEAQRRLSAVALVHKRLYRGDSIEAVDLGRYLEDICADTRESMGAEWRDHLTFELAPMLVSTDRAVNVGLILTELVINANKYAYGGAPGPIAVRLEQHRNRFRLIVADSGTGSHQSGKGFGTRMMNAMVERLAGTIEFAQNTPGLRIIVDAPMAETLS